VNPSATPQQLTIGAVLAALSPDFPDITISKIRFLEAEGLVTPERTGSGYRTFLPDDLERLRYILTAQRDRFWPLKVIAEALDKLDRGLEPVYNDQTPAHPQVPAGPGDPHLPTASELGRRDHLRLTDTELRQAAGLDQLTFEALLDVDPLSHFGHYALGQSLKRLGRRQEAGPHLRLAVAMSPQSALYRAALTRLGLPPRPSVEP